MMMRLSFMQRATHHMGLGILFKKILSSTCKQQQMKNITLSIYVSHL